MAIVITHAPTVIDPQVAAFAPAQFLQALQKRRAPRPRFGIVRGQVHEHADPAHPLALLRLRHHRPRCRRATEQRDELAPTDHSITSSAVESSVGGTVRPSILAVPALITNSNLLDCMTGRSAGLAPLRMRPV